MAEYIDKHKVEVEINAQFAVNSFTKEVALDMLSHLHIADVVERSKIDDAIEEITHARNSVNARNDIFYVGVSWGIDTAMEIIKKHIGVSEIMAEYIDRDRIRFEQLPIAPVLQGDNVDYEQGALKVWIDAMPTADVVERSKIDKAIEKIIDKSFCSDILNDKTDMEIVKLEDVLDILNSI